MVSRAINTPLKINRSISRSDNNLYREIQDLKKSVRNLEDNLERMRSSLKQTLSISSKISNNPKQLNSLFKSSVDLIQTTRTVSDQFSASSKKSQLLLDLIKKFEKVRKRF